MGSMLLGDLAQWSIVLLGIRYWSINCGYICTIVTTDII